MKLGDDQPKFIGTGMVTFWPGRGGGPVITSRFNGAEGVERAGIVEVEPFDEVIYGPGDAPPFGVVERTRYPQFGDEYLPSELVLREGGVIPLDGAVTSQGLVENPVRFSKDPDTSAFVVRYSDERTEVWDGGAKPRLLTSLGLGVSSSQFDDEGDHIVVQYSSGEAYIVDLQVLRGLPPDLAAISDDELIALVCRTVGIQAHAAAPQSCQ